MTTEILLVLIAFFFVAIVFANNQLATPKNYKKSGGAKKRMEFSKKIFFGISLMVSLVVLFSLYMIWETKDLYPLGYLIPAIFAEMSIATGFYFNKAKAENKIKIRNDGERQIKAMNERNFDDEIA